MNATQTIAAVATASGRGAIGIVRLSGDRARDIATRIVKQLPPPRYAALRHFYREDKDTIDRGLIIYFPGPASYTGEDMVEFHTHGGPAVIRELMQTLYAAGAVPARPGEFTERAFLNGKLDLLQAEAVADLISVSTQRGLRSANLAITGHFSNTINSIAAQLKNIRAELEATIDFGDEASVNVEVDHLINPLLSVTADVSLLLERAHKGARLARGVRVVLVGPPNVGKSTLLNALSGQERAIVSDVPGTTRDVLSTEIDIGGVLITLLDTAGLRVAREEIEREGIRRALKEVQAADLILWLYEATEAFPNIRDFLPEEEALPDTIIYVRTKIDALGELPDSRVVQGCQEISLAARHAKGLDLLRDAIAHAMAIEDEGDCPLLARERHLQALATAHKMLSFTSPADFVNDPAESAERLRIAHDALRELTGEFTTEDLLGEIFSKFCIGK